MKYLDSYSNHSFELKSLVATIAASLQGFGICWDTTKVDKTLAWLAWNIISHVPLLILLVLYNSIRIANIMTYRLGAGQKRGIGKITNCRSPFSLGLLRGVYRTRTVFRHVLHQADNKFTL